MAQGPINLKTTLVTRATLLAEPYVPLGLPFDAITCYYCILCMSLCTRLSIKYCWVEFQLSWTHLFAVIHICCTTTTFSTSLETRAKYRSYLSSYSALLLFEYLHISYFGFRRHISTRPKFNSYSSIQPSTGILSRVLKAQNVWKLDKGYEKVRKKKSWGSSIGYESTEPSDANVPNEIMEPSTWRTFWR